MSDISLHEIADESWTRFESISSKISKSLLQAASRIRTAKTAKDVEEIRSIIEGMRYSLEELEDTFRNRGYKDSQSTLDERMRLVIEKLERGIEETEFLLANTKTTSPDTDAGEVEERAEEDVVVRFQVQHTPVDAEQVEAQEYEAMQREIEINKIVNSVGELNQIFHDMDTLVVSQGEMIDNIESNMYSTLENTRMASRQLTKADRWDKQRSRCSCVLMVVVVIAMFILLALIA